MPEKNLEIKRKRERECLRRKFKIERQTDRQTDRDSEQGDGGKKETVDEASRIYFIVKLDYSTS